MGRKRKKITIKKVTIEDAGAKGKSITRLENGLVLFVEGAVPGDVCDVLVHKKRKSFRSQVYSSYFWNKYRVFKTINELRK